MHTVSLAWRNLRRNLRRTVITVAAIAFGLMMMHLIITLNTGSYDAMIKSGVSSLAGHVVVQAEGYQKEQDSDLVVTGAAEVVQKLEATFPGATIAPRILLGGLLTSTTNSVGVGLAGIDGAAEAEIQDLAGKVQQGTWLDGDGRGIVLGIELARSLGVGLDDKVVYLGQHGGATEVNSRLFRVKGIFRTGGAELDGFGAFADLAAVQEAFGQPDIANRITVHLPDPRESDAATALAREAIGRPDLDVRSWRDALPELYGLIQMDRASNDVMLGILGVIVAMGVLNTLLMSVLERTREFGVMLAIGLKPRRLSQLILAEGALIGVIGSLLGLLAGTALSYPLVTYGLDYTSFMGSETLETSGVVISSLLKGQYAPLRMTSYTVGGVVFTILAALYPALHVARLRPVDAMRHV